MAGSAKKPDGVAVITGAASGMGAAAARMMAQAAWPLLLCDLDEAQLEASASGPLEALGVIETLAGDIAAADLPGRLVAALADRPIAALIHCAGLSPTMADPARILEVNLAATLRLVDAVRSRMAPGGAAVLFASLAGHMLGSALDEPLSKATTPETVAALAPFAQDAGAAYSISKRGVQLLARREAAAFGARQARIVSVSPGIIDTPMGHAELRASSVMQGMIAASPLQRLAGADEVAAVAVFLCSPAASFVSGTDILVDGGTFAALATPSPPA